MNYIDIYNLLKPLGYNQTAITWKDEETTPDIFIRYYVVTGMPECNYNGDDKKKKTRYTFFVYDRSGENFEGIFKKLQEKIEDQNGFKKFFSIKDGIDTGHHYRRGDVYQYE